MNITSPKLVIDKVARELSYIGMDLDRGGGVCRITLDQVIADLKAMQEWLDK